MNITCDKCNNDLPKRTHLICVLCKRRLDLSCANVSSKLFYLMSREEKKNWKCQPCISQQNNSTKTEEERLDSDSDTDHDTITTQDRYNIPVDNSFESLSEITLESDKTEQLSSQTTVKLNRSCPEIGHNTYEEIERLKCIISELQTKLEAADHEIINLLSENIKYKENLSKCGGKISVLKQICRGTPTKVINSSSGKSEKKIHRTRLDLFQLEKTKKGILNMSTGDEGNYKRKQQTNKGTIYQSTPNRRPIRNMNNILILSSNTRNKLLPVIENEFGTEYNYCHHVTPNVGALQILEGIETKVHELTKRDYVVIMIGETDFKTSKDYKELIVALQNKLQIIQHTNIVICYPTYKYGWYTELFNSRVECFIRLLEKDVQVYQYAYLLDSNRHLNYEMFMVGGCVNRTGMKNIINNLGKLVHDINNLKSKNDTTELLNLNGQYTIASQQTTTNNINDTNVQINDKQFFRA